MEICPQLEEPGPGQEQREYVGMQSWKEREWLEFNLVAFDKENLEADFQHRHLISYQSKIQMEYKKNIAHGPNLEALWFYILFF